MGNRNERHVTPHAEGWQVKKPGSTRASALAPTQGDAIALARQFLENDGGGELVIHRPDGRIRDSDTVPPAPDPYPPRDTK